jgi:hypothetical protein
MFGLDEIADPTQARSNQYSGLELGPTHASLQSLTAIMITTSDSSIVSCADRTSLFGWTKWGRRDAPTAFPSSRNSDAATSSISYLVLMRFIQIGPVVVRIGRKRCDYPAAVGGRKPESRKQAGELPCLSPRDSACPKLRHRRDDDFHGPAVRICCDTGRNDFGELVP